MDSIAQRLSFSRVTDADFEELLAIRLAALRESLERVGRYDPALARERMRKSFYPEHSRFIQCDGQRVGFYTFRPAHDGFHLEHLYVIPGTQGAGVGSHVLHQLCEQADSHRMPIFLGVLLNSPANGFYQRHGFVATQQSETVVFYVRTPMPISCGV